MRTPSTNPPAGSTAARREQAPLKQPRWDAAQHTLWWGRRRIKEFKGDAPAQEGLLAAFEAKGWPRCLDVAPRGKKARERKARLRNAVRNLNRGVKPYLHFSQAGCGDRVRWERLSEE